MWAAYKPLVGLRRGRVSQLDRFLPNLFWVMMSHISHRGRDEESTLSLLNAAWGQAPFSGDPLAGDLWRFSSGMTQAGLTQGSRSCPLAPCPHTCPGPF